MNIRDLLAYPPRLGHWRLPIALGLLSLIAQWPALAPYLRYERAAILHGEIWRLFSAHLTHLSWTHLALNLLALALIWQLFGDRFRPGQWLLIFVLVSLGISLGLLVLFPRVHWYAGMSGSLHGLFAAGALAQWRSGNWLGPVLLAGLAIKLIREHWFGPLAGSVTLTGGPVLTQAHLLGALAGLLIAMFILAKRQ